MTLEQKELHGLAASFDSPDQMVTAAVELRKAGYTRMEAYTPFPIHGIEEKMGLPGSFLGYIVICLGLTGTSLALLLQWWTGAGSPNLFPMQSGLNAYPLIIGGKPLFALEPSIPITFELTVLLSAFAAVFGMIALNGLPRLYHPLFNYRNAVRITDDQFVLVVEKTDPKFEVAELTRMMQSLGGHTVEAVEE